MMTMMPKTPESQGVTRPNPRLNEMLHLGIDLGTTNSCVATVNEKQNGEIVVRSVDIPQQACISNSLQRTTIRDKKLPSMVYYQKGDDVNIIIGPYAKAQYSLRPDRVAKSIKSQIGNPYVTGLADDISDKSPQEVQARILSFLLDTISKRTRTSVTEAVITVPASFNPAMREATLEAARLAGIKTEYPDGTPKPLLLSEPNAGIYDLVNQIENGEIDGRILDLSKKKRVLVFDLGGGTLDLTIHDLEKKDDGSGLLNITEIACNRYTRLGGDDFDSALGEKMFQNYLKQYKNSPTIMKQIREKKDSVMAQMTVFAENMKIELNETQESEYAASGWDQLDGEDEFDTFNTGGFIPSTGYAYSDSFSRNQLEEIFSPLLAPELSMDDLETNHPGNATNIIAPILEVLRQAKINDPESPAGKIDVVIMNGGMSKFYLVQQRVKDFFGIEPVTVLDPDLSVSRGAAIYHYLLCKNNVLGQPDAQTVSRNNSFASPIRQNMPSKDQEQAPAEKLSSGKLNIQWTHRLNEPLYLGLKNGAVSEIAPAGTALPYHSNLHSGYMLAPGQSVICIPIKLKNADDSYRTIAYGNMRLKQPQKESSYFSFTASISADKRVSINATVSKDPNGLKVIQSLTAEILIGSVNEDRGPMPLPPAGNRLHPHNEISSFISQSIQSSRKKMSMESLRTRQKVIESAGNPQDFAVPLLNSLKTVKDPMTVSRLLSISKRMSRSWTEEERNELERACLNILSSRLSGFNKKGDNVTRDISALAALLYCGSRNSARKVLSLKSDKRFRNTILHLCAQYQIETDMIVDEFYHCLNKLNNGSQTVGLQEPLFWLGKALRKGNLKYVTKANENNLMKELTKLLSSGILLYSEPVLCIMAAGLIGDRRYEYKPVCEEVQHDFLKALTRFQQDYPDDAVSCQKIIAVTTKILNNEVLNYEEEQFLLSKLDV